MAFFDSQSKQPAELLILFASPKDSFVRSFKNSAYPFQHDALPMNESSFGTQACWLIFSEIPVRRSNSVRNVGTFMSF
jgi:hypothetical protein